VTILPGGRYTLFEPQHVCCVPNKSVLQEVPTNMANDVRVRVTLVCSECKQRNYDTKKNKKNDPDRIELKKYCRFCRKHTVHKESK
jgi:large subunit ribosomal protein L33